MPRRLMEEIALASRALKAVTGCDKLNIAAIGNVVPQLHVHIVARWKERSAVAEAGLGLSSARAPAIARWPSRAFWRRCERERLGLASGDQKSRRESVGGGVAPACGGRLVGRLVDHFECRLESSRHRDDDARQARSRPTPALWREAIGSS